jgi:DNA modification methylase
MQNWPADKVERRSVSSLVPYARNARTHSSEQVDQIAASIKEWGWTVPVLVDEEGGLIAGHGRVLAAKKLGLKEIPVMVAAGWSEAQKRAYVLADNKLALNAGWDNDLLKVELEGLRELDFDLDLTGFGADELAVLLAEKTEGLTDPDEVPEAPEIPVSELGDVWLLGKHRLACGDCTIVETVDKALNGVKPHLMVTDPPYGVEYDPVWREKAGLNGPLAAKGIVLNDDRADWREAWALFSGEVAYVWHADRFSPVVAESLEVCDFQMRNLIIWGKSQLVMSRGNYHSQHEPCWYAVRKGATAHWAGDRKQTTLWQIEKPRKSETGHGTQKPVECMKRPIENNSSPGQAVYEPFSGSGTTIIAAETTGRCCHAIELNPAYVDVAIERWQNFTGQEAVLEATGQTFKSMKEARSAGLDTSPTIELLNLRKKAG